MNPRSRSPSPARSRSSSVDSSSPLSNSPRPSTPTTTTTSPLANAPRTEQPKRYGDFQKEEMRNISASAQKHVTAVTEKSATEPHPAYYHKRSASASRHETAAKKETNPEKRVASYMMAQDRMQASVDSRVEDQKSFAWQKSQPKTSQDYKNWKGHEDAIKHERKEVTRLGAAVTREKGFVAAPKARERFEASKTK